MVYAVSPVSGFNNNNYKEYNMVFGAIVTLKSILFGFFLFYFIFYYILFYLLLNALLEIERNISGKRIKIYFLYKF